MKFFDLVLNFHGDSARNLPCDAYIDHAQHRQ